MKRFRTKIDQILRISCHDFIYLDLQRHNVLVFKKCYSRLERRVANWMVKIFFEKL